MILLILASECKELTVILKISVLKKRKKYVFYHLYLANTKGPFKYYIIKRYHYGKFLAAALAACSSRQYILLLVVVELLSEFELFWFS